MPRAIRAQKPAKSLEGRSATAKPRAKTKNARSGKTAPKHGGKSIRSTSPRPVGARAAAAPTQVLIVNMIPRTLSGETNQDSEPTLAVNPVNPQQIVGTAFTPDPLGGETAPVFISLDGGNTWSLNSIVPSQTQTGDICVGFGRTDGKLYAGILRVPSADTRLNILRANDFQSADPMTVLVDRLGVDQPFVQTMAISVGTGKGKDRVYVGNNDFGAQNGQTSTIDFSLNAATAKAKFKSVRIESRQTGGQNGPQVRPACHPDGPVYLAYMGWRSSTGSWPANTLLVTADLVVVRDDAGGNSTKPFQALRDPDDNKAGRRVVQSISFPFHHDGGSVPGQQRLGGDVAITVNPSNSGDVYIAWADLRQNVYTVHVRRSTDRGVTWSATDLRTLPHATNPALAINSSGIVGLLYQQLTGIGASLRWVTHFERTSDGVNWNDLILCTAPANEPRLLFSPYLGDYDFVLAVENTFYGIFSANNTPDKSHFPNGVVYQRNADFNTRRLLDTDNTTPVAISIDPFFFKVSA